jgi:hypothetical protein
MRFIIVAIVANSIYGHYTKSAADAPRRLLRAAAENRYRRNANDHQVLH